MTTEWNGRYRASVEREGTATYFHQLPMSAKQTTALKEFYNERLHCKNAWKMANYRMGANPGMMFTVDVLKSELKFQKEHGGGTTNTAAKLNSALDMIDAQALNGDKLSLCSILSVIRKAGGIHSSQFILANTYRENVRPQGHYWRRSTKNKAQAKGFYPFKQRLVALGSGATATKTFNLRGSNNNSDGNNGSNDSDETVDSEEDDLDAAMNLLN